MRIVLGVLFALFLIGCELSSSDDDPVFEGSVIVANQGNFSDGNGSVTVYDPGSMKSSAIATSIGSIVQSVLVVDDRVLIASNTGNSVDLFDPTSGDQVGQVPEVPSPRYMARVSANRIVVTNLFANVLSFVDLESSSVVSMVDVGSNPEGVTIHANVAYVANHAFGAGNTLTEVDLASRSVSRTITVNCDGPRFTAIDRQSELLVVCTGQTLFDDDFNVIGTTNGAVLVLDATTGAEKGRINVDGMVVTAGPGQDANYSSRLGRLFLVRDQRSILIVDTDLDVVASDIGPLSGDPIGGVAYREADGYLYVARVPGFTQAGSVTILTLEGDTVGRFSAGVAPSHIDFVERRP